MGRRRRKDAYDFVEVLIKFALQKIGRDTIDELEYAYLYEYAAEKYEAVFGQHVGVTHLAMPSEPAIKGVCDLVIHEAADFVLILTGLTSQDAIGREIAWQQFHREIYLLDPYAEVIRRHAALAIEAAVWQVTTYRLVE